MAIEVNAHHLLWIYILVVAEKKNPQVSVSGHVGELDLAETNVLLTRATAIQVCFDKQKEEDYLSQFDPTLFSIVCHGTRN